MIPPAVHRFAWAGTTLAALAVIVVATAAEGTRPWDGWDEGRELRRPGYAERVRPDRPIRTRANTFSNLAYVTVGLYACGLAVADRKRGREAPSGSSTGNVVIATPALSMLFGLSCLWLGFSSALFHASLTRAGQRLDVAAMYPPLLSLLAIAAARAVPARIPLRRGGSLPTWALLAVAVVVAEIALWRWKWAMSATTVLASLIVAMTLVTVAEHGLRPGRFQSAWLGWGACLLVAGIVCRQSDVAGTFPVGPDALLQGHALWHGFTAAALGALYFHERSEAPWPEGRGANEGGWAGAAVASHQWARRDSRQRVILRDDIPPGPTKGVPLTTPSPKTGRWSEPDDLAIDAERRCGFVARFLRSGLRIIDLGCGRMDLERLLSPSFYVPVDHVARDSRTRVIDLNAAPIPAAWLDRVQVATMLGVIEHLADPAAAMTQLASRGVALLASYRATSLPAANSVPHDDRINAFAVSDVEALARSAGYRLAFRYVFEGRQAVWLWVPDGVDPSPLTAVGLPPRRDETSPRPKLVVAGFLGRGNCGDEAIFQVIHETFSGSHDIVAAVDEHGAFEGFWDWYPYDRSRISHQGNLAVFEQHGRVAGLLVGGGGLPCGFAGGLVDAARGAGVPTALAGVDLTLPAGRTPHPRALHDYLARFDDVSMRSQSAAEAVAAVGIAGHHAGDWALSLEADRRKDLFLVRNRVAVVVREESIEYLAGDFVEAIEFLLAGLRTRGYEPFFLPFCPEDERLLGDLALLGTAPTERCWWNPRLMKQVIATSGAVVSVGRLHPLVFAASTRTPVMVLAAPSRAVAALPKLHDMAVELGVLEVSSVAEALSHFDRGLPPASDAGRLADCQARVDGMIARLRRLFGS